MQIIGLIGGMSWESTALYYKLINERVRDRMGKLHSAPLLMYSYDFQEIKDMQYGGRWEEAATSLAEVARRLEGAGARAIVLCTNTMHKLAPDIMSKVTIPFIHIGDATAQRIRARGYRRVGLLGTKFTMEEDFYIDRLRAHDLDVLVPPTEARADVNRIIYDELCLGIVAAPSRNSRRDSGRFRNRVSRHGLGQPLPLAGEVGAKRREGAFSALGVLIVEIPPPQPPPQAGEGAHPLAATIKSNLITR